ncbi:MAG: translocation/assembly module TamB domain-containing protein, partial [Inhella sp.]
ASRLTGQLRLQDQGQGLRATGLIESQGGRYKAYGQTLDLESGEIRFNGSLDNPRLDLLAIKPDIEHRVGVSVTGSAQSPRVRLYAEPELPDNDKLAWLLLGRDPAEVEGRDTAILQRAALALLSGESGGPASDLMDKLGLTEFSISQGDDAATVLRLGAQLSRRWSVGYERSLNAATGSWQLVYRLGQRFRLRAQSGLDSAVDLLWLWRYD